VRHSLQLQLDRLASDRWARRGVRILLRASALALSLVCLALGAHLLTGQPLRWTLVGAGALACIALGALLVLRPRLRAPEVARRLDRRFTLNEQLTTALELGPQAEGVGLYLYDQARRSLAQIRRQVAARQRFPWSELALVLCLAVLLTGLAALADIAPRRAGALPEPLPPLARVPDPAERVPPEPFAPPPPVQQELAAGGEGLAPVAADPAAAAALADALRDQSVTRPAAEALDQGRPGEAARQLRELADQVGQLSPQARNDLGQALREAARQIAPTSPGLAEQLNQSADGLAAGGGQAAAALEDLASLVEQFGQSQASDQAPGAPHGQSAGQGASGAGQGSLPGDQRERASQRLGVDGVPLELASDGGSTVPGAGNAEQASAPEGGTAGTGSFTRGSQSNERVSIGDDPLRIPADLRDVVQDYFSP